MRPGKLDKVQHWDIIVNSPISGTPSPVVDNVLSAFFSLSTGCISSFTPFSLRISPRPSPNHQFAPIMSGGPPSEPLPPYSSVAPGAYPPPAGGAFSPPPMGSPYPPAAVSFAPPAAVALAPPLPEEVKLVTSAINKAIPAWQTRIATAVGRHIPLMLNFDVLLASCPNSQARLAVLYLLHYFVEKWSNRGRRRRREG